MKQVFIDFFGLSKEQVGTLKSCIRTRDCRFPHPWDGFFITRKKSALEICDRFCTMGLMIKKPYKVMCDSAHVYKLTDVGINIVTQK